MILSGRPAGVSSFPKESSSMSTCSSPCPPEHDDDGAVHDDGPSYWCSGQCGPRRDRGRSHDPSNLCRSNSRSTANSSMYSCSDRPCRSSSSCCLMAKPPTGSTWSTRLRMAMSTSNRLRPSSCLRPSSRRLRRPHHLRRHRRPQEPERPSGRPRAPSRRPRGPRVSSIFHACFRTPRFFPPRIERLHWTAVPVVGRREAA